MHVIFGRTEERQFPARDDRPAGTAYEQKAWIVEPGQDGEPDTSVPFTVSHRDPRDCYPVGEPHEFTAAHFSVNRFGRPEFSPYARYRLLDAPASADKPEPKLSQLAAAAGPLKAAS